MHELDELLLLIRPNSNKKITIKFNKRYSTNTDIVKVVFSNIIKDYELYKQNGQEENNLIEATIVI